MKKTLSAIAVIAALVMSLAGCGSTHPTAENNSAAEATTVANVEATTEAVAEATTEEAVEATTEASNGNNSIVIFFSATGTTKGVAEHIASVTGSDIYEIVPAQPYSAADLDYSDSSSRTSIETNDPSARPEIAGEMPALDQYDTIYLGYPIWWGDAPRIMSTYVEANNFDGKTIAPFCTSSSSGVGASAKNLAEQAGSGNWLDGVRFSGGASENELKSWIDGLQ